MGFLKQLSISQKLWLSFGLTILLAFGANMAGQAASTGLRNSMANRLLPAEEALSQVLNARSHVQTMGSETTMYILTGDKKHRDNKFKADDGAVAAFEKAMEILKGLKVKPELLKHMQAVEEADENGCHPLEQKMVALVAAGKKQDAMRILTTQYAPALEKLKSKAKDFEVALKKFTVSVADEAAATAKFQGTVSWILLAVVGLLGIVMAHTVIQSITKPISILETRMTEMRQNGMGALLTSADSLAEGDLTYSTAAEIRPIKIHGNDEIARIFGVYNETQADMQRVLHAFEEAKQRLTKVVRGVQMKTESLSHSAVDLTSSFQQASASSHVIGQSMRQVDEHMDENLQSIAALSSASLSLADHASKAAEETDRLTAQLDAVKTAADDQLAAAAAASQSAADGGESVEKTLAVMAAIQKQVEESSVSVASLGKRQALIGEIVATIGDIADQTNLLALNAAIEAARAGDHGRGFAVVADEVRGLAERCRKATKEISDLIRGVQTGMNEAIASMEASKVQVKEGAEVSQAGARQIAEVLKQTQDFERLAKATHDSVKHMTKGMMGVSDTIDHVASISEETAASATEMTEASENTRLVIQSAAEAVGQQQMGLDEVSRMAESLSLFADELGVMTSSFTVASPQADLKRAA